MKGNPVHQYHSSQILPNPLQTFWSVDWDFPLFPLSMHCIHRPGLYGDHPGRLRQCDGDGSRREL